MLEHTFKNPQEVCFYFKARWINPKIIVEDLIEATENQIIAANRTIKNEEKILNPIIKKNNPTKWRSRVGYECNIEKYIKETVIVIGKKEYKKEEFKKLLIKENIGLNKKSIESFNNEIWARQEDRLRSFCIRDSMFLMIDNNMIDNRTNFWTIRSAKNPIIKGLRRYWLFYEKKYYFFRKLKNQLMFLKVIKKKYFRELN